MNCKNCQQHLEDSASYCPNCGAKVVLSKLSLKVIWRSFRDDFFGWDNKYLYTLKVLALKPELVFKEYLTGTRKKYLAPFAFLAIGTALAMLVFNQFADKYIEMSTALNEKQFEIIGEQFDNKESIERLEEQRVTSLKSNEDVQGSILKYFNILTFLLIPLYALVAFWVFGKPYNYGEHLVIACYAQGFLFIAVIISFILSILLTPIIYYVSIFIAVGYYLFSYGRLYKFTIGQLALKFFKFLAILLLIFLLFAAIVFVVELIKHKVA